MNVDLTQTDISPIIPSKRGRPPRILAEGKHKEQRARNAKILEVKLWKWAKKEENQSKYPDLWAKVALAIRDSYFGRAPIAIDQRITSRIMISPDDLALASIIQAQEQLLLSNEAIPVDNILDTKENDELS